MPLQNRVTPFGDIVAIAQRGLFTGNRGILHDIATKTLLPRRWTNKAWIVCSLHDRGRWREVMGQHSWTELFFLDEAVALAAGHRPCFACRRDAALAFRAAWQRAHGSADAPFAPQMDAVLHAERLDGRRRRVHALTRDVATLPDGAVVARGDDAFTMVRGRGHRWTAAGYERRPHAGPFDTLLTPPSTLRVIEAGYAPVLHGDLATRRG